MGVVNWQLLETSNASLEFALRTATDDVYILHFVAISALFATTSVIMSSIVGVFPSTFAMARQGVLPIVLSRISHQKVPVVTVLLCGVIISEIVIASGGILTGSPPYSISGHC